ncbi:GNAT family N-acetyltransferase [Microbacterium lacticum]
MSLRIIVDDLTAAPTRALIAAHLAGMHENSPPESVHALDFGALAAPGVTVWSAWRDDDLVGIGALAQLDSELGELKSMRVDDRFRGTGAVRFTRARGSPRAGRSRATRPIRSPPS